MVFVVVSSSQLSQAPVSRCRGFSMLVLATRRRRRCEGIGSKHVFPQVFYNRWDKLLMLGCFQTRVFAIVVQLFRGMFKTNSETQFGVVVLKTYWFQLRTFGARCCFQTNVFAIRALLFG